MWQKVIALYRGSPGSWHDLLHVTCRLTACTPGSAVGPALGNECGRILPFLAVTCMDDGSCH